MKKAKSLLGLMGLGAALLAITAVTSTPAEAYSYQTYDRVVVGKKCRFGNSGCYNVYGWRWVWHYVPDTRVSSTATSLVNRVRGASAGDSAGNGSICATNGCAASGIASQTKTAVPTLDYSTALTVNKINSTAPYLPAR